MLSIQRKLFLNLSLIFLSFTMAISSAQAQPTPVTEVDVEASVLFSNTIPIKVRFKNTGDVTGFFPMMEVKLSQGIECNQSCQDAVEISSIPGASFYYDFHAGPKDFQQNKSGEPLRVEDQESYFVVIPPLGTLAPGQPDIELTIPAKFSDEAKLGESYTIEARSLFLLGELPNGLRGPCGADGVNTLCSEPYATGTVTPSLLQVEKKTVGLFEGAVSTGPNYPRQFTITGEVATDKTIDQVTLSDTIPQEVIINDPPDLQCAGGNFSITPAPETCEFNADPQGGGSFTVSYPALTGGSGTELKIQYEGYVQEFVHGSGAPVVDPVSGQTTQSQNQISVDYQYNGQSYPTIEVDATILQKSIDLIKTSQVTDDQQAQGFSPGDTVHWRVRAYVSDYFSFTDNQGTLSEEFSDFMGDGQEFLPNTLKITLEEKGQSASVNEAALIEKGYLVFGQEDDGRQTFTIDLIAAMIDESHLFGEYFSDGVLNGSTDTGRPTLVTVEYDTRILESYRQVTGSGNTAIVASADTIRNDAEIALEVTDGALVPMDSSQSIKIAKIKNATKQVRYKNGQVPTDNKIAPNDEITYLISVQVPTGDVENLVYKDYLPQPIFKVSTPNVTDDSAWTKISTCDLSTNTIPQPGEYCFTTESDVQGGEELILTDVDNGIAWDFGDSLEDAGASQPKQVQILFTVRATYEPMANDLQLVNYATVTQANSFTENVVHRLVATQNHLIQEPELKVFKNVIAGSEGTVNGAGNLIDAEAGTVVTFEVAIENRGAFTAFDIKLEDIFDQNQLEFVDDNFQISWSNESQCNHNGATSPQVSASGAGIIIRDLRIEKENTCRFSYQLRTKNSLEAGAQIENTATVTYASQPGGTTFPPDYESASVTASQPSITKTLDSFSGEKTPGETIVFDFAVVFPESQLKGAKIIDEEKGNWVEFKAEADNIEWLSEIHEGVIGEQNVWCLEPVTDSFDNNLCFTQDPRDVSLHQVNNTQYTIPLGDVTNGYRDNQDRTLQFKLSGIVRANAKNNKKNTAKIEWQDPNGGGTQSVSDTLTTPVFTPKLGLSKCATDATLNQVPISLSESVSYVMQVKNTGSRLSTAYDVAPIVDYLPQGLRFNQVSAAYYCSAGANRDSCEHNWSADADCVDVTAAVQSGVAQESPVQQDDGDVGIQQLVEIPVVGENSEPTLPPNAYFAVVMATEMNCAITADNSGTDAVAGVHPSTSGGLSPCSEAALPFVDSFFNQAFVEEYSSQAGLVPLEGQYSQVSSNLVELDADHDGDGIPNSVEGNQDSDGDGVPNYLDTDSDDNGYSDQSEYQEGQDLDGDGVPDVYDADDDGDQSNDATEIIAGGGVQNPDYLSDTPDHQNPDADNDGIADGPESSLAKNANVDEQDDGANHKDLDADNDGIPDLVEMGLDVCDSNQDGVLSEGELDQCSAEVCANSPCDIDGNGALESDEFVDGKLPDADGDDIPNAYDLDSDNDGLSDLVEANLSACDTDGDGQINEGERPLCDDGQGGEIVGNQPNKNQVVNFADLSDFDQDGLPDFLDSDSDQDGVPDIIENGRFQCDTDGDGQISEEEMVACSLDTNEDGVIDLDELAVPNFKEDTNPNYLNTDSDNDGIDDWIEVYSPPVDQNQDGSIDPGEYTGGTGQIGNRDSSLTQDELRDTDQDNNPDIYDDDSDNDGVPDVFDQYPQDSERAFAVRYPPSGDYFIAFEDNFPKVGDGDYNDLIVAYNITEVTNSDNKIVDIIGKASLVARGACFDHNFNMLINFEGTGLLSKQLYDEYGFLVDNLDLGSRENLADVRLFKNTMQMIKDPLNRNCSMANTHPYYDLVQGYRASFTLYFPEPLAKAAIDAPPYDPYLFVLRRGGEYGYDVHLPNKPAIEGSRNPVETAESNFIDADGYPWALFVPENWRFPREGKFLEDAYTDFTEFRASRGSENLLWYLEANDNFVRDYPDGFFSF